MKRQLLRLLMSIMSKNVIDLVSIVDCQMEVVMAPISDSVTCLVKDTCTSVSCCVDIGFMKTSFEAYLTLDACNYWLDVGIEKLSFNLSLKDVIFGIFCTGILFFFMFYFKVSVFCTDFNVNFQGLFIHLEIQCTIVLNIFFLSGTKNSFYLNNVIRIELVIFVVELYTKQYVK